jgi:hypothetical protein
MVRILFVPRHRLFSIVSVGMKIAAAASARTVHPTGRTTDIPCHEERVQGRGIRLRYPVPIRLAWD